LHGLKNGYDAVFIYCGGLSVGGFYSIFGNKNSVETTCLNYQVSTPTLPANCSTPLYTTFHILILEADPRKGDILWKNDSSRTNSKSLFYMICLCFLAR
jgi:hypothetical protein